MTLFIARTRGCAPSIPDRAGAGEPVVEPRAGESCTGASLSPKSDRHVHHGSTITSTVTTERGAMRHLLVSGDGLAIVGTGIAQLRTGAANRSVLRRPAHQRVGRHLAHLGAVKQQRQMRGRDVGAALFGTISRRLKAHAVRLDANIYAALSGHWTLSHARHAGRLSPGDAAGCGQHEARS